MKMRVTKKEREQELNNKQIQLTESEMSYWPFMSCISVRQVWPRLRPFRRLGALVPSFLQEEWTWSHIMTNSFASLSPRYRLDPFFTRHVSSKHSNTTMAFFQTRKSEEINFVRNLSLSPQHIFARFGNRCFPPCFTTRRRDGSSYLSYIGDR